MLNGVMVVVEALDGSESLSLGAIMMWLLGSLDFWVSLVATRKYAHHTQISCFG